MTDLVDDIHGGLNGRGSCIVPQRVAAGGFYECSFSTSFVGQRGDSETDTVTATLEDDESNSVTAEDSATFWITDPIFSDGFEFGDTTAWSGSVP